MCMLCAAVPATLALGAVDRAKRRRSSNRARPPAVSRRFPISLRAAVIAATLVVCAAIFHSRGLLLA